MKREDFKEDLTALCRQYWKRGFSITESENELKIKLDKSDENRTN